MSDPEQKPESKRITIFVTGERKAGKSTMVSIIANAMIERGQWHGKPPTIRIEDGDDIDGPLDADIRIVACEGDASEMIASAAHTMVDLAFRAMRSDEFAERFAELRKEIRAGA